MKRIRVWVLFWFFFFFVKSINYCVHSEDELCHHVHIVLNKRLILNDDSSGNMETKFSLNSLVQAYEKNISFV